MQKQIVSIEDLLSNESFLKYCLGDETEAAFWEAEQLSTSGLKERVQEARKFIEFLKAEMVDPELEAEKLLKLIRERNKIDTKKVKFPFYRKWIWPAAAAIFLLFTVTFYLVSSNHKNNNDDKIVQSNPARDVAPGGTKAVLTLSNGSQVVLDSSSTGTIDEGNIKILKLANGPLSYSGTDNNNGAEAYNSISTPKGGQYQVILSDGTKVWLNAVSSIKFPVRFTGIFREVEVSGEVYFEVAKDKAHPFIVKNKESNALIEVTGTAFNVNAYKDDGNIKVTLVEGGVKISTAGIEKVIKPGQQASLNNESIQIKAVNIKEIIAWKYGRFDFGEGASIQSIMHQLSRWYDLDIEYRGEVKELFWGSLSRNVNVSQVLKMLEATGGIKFKIEGNKIIVMPTLK